MKGFSIAIRLVMAVVVMVAIAFILISITSGGLHGFSKDTQEQQSETGAAAADAATRAYCALACCEEGEVNQECQAEYGGSLCTSVISNEDCK